MANVDCAIARVMYVTVCKDATLRMDDVLVCIVMQTINVNSLANQQIAALCCLCEVQLRLEGR